MNDFRSLILAGSTGKPKFGTLEGREHLIVPVVMLVEGVIHAVNAQTPELVPLSTLQAAAQSWNGRPVTLGHPVKDGRQCSANEESVINSRKLGTMLNVRVEGKKMLGDAYVDVASAKRLLSEAQYKDLSSGVPIEVSVGAVVATNGVSGDLNGKAYKDTWARAAGDHLAFLPGGRGACSIEMGCGTCRAASAYEVDGDELRELSNPEGINQYTGGGGSGKQYAVTTKATNRYFEGEKTPGGKVIAGYHDTLSGAKNHASVLAQRSGRAYQVHDMKTGTIVHEVGTREPGQVYNSPSEKGKSSDIPKMKGAEANVNSADFVALANPEGINQYTGGGGKFSVEKVGNEHHVMMNSGGEKVGIAAHTSEDDAHDHAQALSEGNHRSHEGAQGSRTPEEGDRVKIVGQVAGSGKTGKVVESRGSFHVVKTSDGKSGSYQSSQLRTDSGTSRRLEAHMTDEEILRAARDITAKQRKDASDSDFAGKGQSFPILKPEDVSAAAASIGRAGPDNYSTDQLKANIIKIAKRKGAEFVAQLPKAWQDEMKAAAAGDDTEEAAEAIAYGSMQTALDAASVALDEAVSHVKTLVDDDTLSDEEEDAHLDAVATACTSAISSLYAVCRTADDQQSDDDAPMSAGRYMEAFRAAGEALRTAAGKRNNAVDMKTIQDIHDSTQKLGAACDMSNASYRGMQAGDRPELRAACGCDTGAACSCKGEGQMTKEQKAGVIAALVTNPHSGFTDDDVRMLESVKDERLEAFRVAAEARQAEAKAKADAETEARNAAAKVTVLEGKIKNLEATPTEEQWLARAPESVKEMFEERRAAEEARRDELIGKLKTLGHSTEEELKAMSTKELERLGVFAKVDQPVRDFSGKGVPNERRAAGKKEEEVSYAPPDPYSAALDKMRAAEAAFAARSR